MNTETAIKTYQCSGCVSGTYPDCFIKEDSGIGCTKQCAGTSIASPSIGINTIFLGLPKGFCRIGYQKDMQVYIFESQVQQEKEWKYDKFNIPVWKHLDEHGNILVRGYMPRLNLGFIHVILNGDIKKIKGKTITKKDMKEMD